MFRVVNHFTNQFLKPVTGPERINRPRGGSDLYAGEEPDTRISKSLRRRKARPVAPATHRLSDDDVLCSEGPVHNFEKLVQTSQELKSKLSEAGVEGSALNSLHWCDPEVSCIGAPVHVGEGVGGPEPLMTDPVPSTRPSTWLAWFFPTDYHGVAEDVINYVAAGDSLDEAGDSEHHRLRSILSHIKERLVGNHVRRHRVAYRIGNKLKNLRPMIDELRARVNRADLVDTSAVARAAVEVAVRRLLKDQVAAGVILDRECGFYQRILVALAPVVTDDDRLAVAIERLIPRLPRA